jgi:hypothetical protein
MKVITTENVAMMAQVVTSAEDYLVKVIWEADELRYQYAKCAYVKIAGSNVRIPGLDSSEDQLNEEH